jgi:photosynthetic reaction center cytochrome c subunit
VSGPLRRAVRPIRSILAALSLTALLAPVGVSSAQPPRKLPPLENVKVLTGWDAAQVRDEMRRMSEAIGVKCDHCHVQGNFASDEKRAKHTGRRMLQMTLALNQEHFPSHTPAEGESRLGRITCYTCHQGQATPKISTGFGAER